MQDRNNTSTQLYHHLLLLDNRHRQIAPDCHRLPQIAHVMVQVENGGTWWTHVTCRILPYSARVAELTNHDFLCPAWKITIDLLSASALAALKISV